jgi:hypothetical protein
VVVFAVMITMVVLMLFSVWYVNFTQSSTKKEELEHIQAVAEDFRHLQSLILSMRENNLGTAEFRMSPAPVVGVPSPNRASMFWVENESDNSPGLVCLEMGNVVYPGYAYIYESGAVLIQQGARVNMKFEPRAFSLENGGLVYTEVRLKDPVPKSAGTGRVTLILFVENVSEEQENENIYIWSSYPPAWERYLSRVVENLKSIYENIQPPENLGRGWKIWLGPENTFIHRIVELSVRAVC